MSIWIIIRSVRQLIRLDKVVCVVSIIQIERETHGEQLTERKRIVLCVTLKEKRKCEFYFILFKTHKEDKSEVSL